MNLKELQEKPESTKKKIIITVAAILTLILGFWWFRNTRQHLQNMQQEELEVEFPAPEESN